MKFNYIPCGPPSIYFCNEAGNADAQRDTTKTGCGDGEGETQKGRLRGTRRGGLWGVQDSAHQGWAQAQLRGSAWQLLALHVLKPVQGWDWSCVRKSAGALEWKEGDSVWVKSLPDVEAQGCLGGDGAGL